MNTLFKTNIDNMQDSPLGRDHYWNVVKKDPRFPKPLAGSGNRQQIYSTRQMDEFWEKVAETGFILSDEKEAC